MNKKSGAILFLCAFLLLCFSSGALAFSPVSEQETNELLPAVVQQSYLKVKNDINSILNSYWNRAFDSIGFDMSEVDFSVPLVVNIDANGKVYFISSPFKEIKATKDIPEGEYETFTFKVKDDRNEFFQKTYGLDDTGKLMYKSILDLPITKYVLGNMKYNTTNFFNSIDSLVDTDQKTVLRDLRNKVGGAGGLDKMLQDDQDVFTKVLMTYIPMGFIVLGLAVQLGMMMYSSLFNQRISVGAVLIRWAVYVFVILTYKSWVGWCIDFFSVISAFVVPEETQTYVISNLLSTSSMTSYETGVVAGWIADFARYLGYIAVQILMIMRDVLLSISVLFGALIIAISFPSSAEGNKASDFGRNMLSGWIEGFTRLMLWAPIASACIVLLGITSVLSAVGAQSALTTIVMAIAMMFSCTKVPDLAEKMSGQALATVYAILGGAVMNTAGGAVGGTVNAGVRGAGAVIRRLGRASSGAAAVGGAMRTSKGLGNIVKSTATSTVQKSQQQETSQDDGPHVRMKAT